MFGVSRTKEGVERTSRDGALGFFRLVERGRSLWGFAAGLEWRSEAGIDIDHGFACRRVDIARSDAEGELRGHEAADGLDLRVRHTLAWQRGEMDGLTGFGVENALMLKGKVCAAKVAIVVLWDLHIAFRRCQESEQLGSHLDLARHADMLNDLAARSAKVE